MTPSERRVKAIWLPCDFIINVINWRDGDTLQLPVLRALPASARLLAVHYMPQTKGFLFIVHDPSFDAVPEGRVIPPWDEPEGATGIEWETVKLHNPKIIVAPLHISGGRLPS